MAIAGGAPRRAHRVAADGRMRARRARAPRALAGRSFVASIIPPRRVGPPRARGARAPRAMRMAPHVRRRRGALAAHRDRSCSGGRRVARTPCARAQRWPALRAAIDAPVSGGVEGAKNGKLSIMVGGAADVLEKARPVLEAYAAKVTHLGAVGAGQATRAVNQVLVAGIAQAVCAGLALGEALGRDPARSMALAPRAATGSRTSAARASRNEFASQRSLAGTARARARCHHRIAARGHRRQARRSPVIRRRASHRRRAAIAMKIRIARLIRLKQPRFAHGRAGSFARDRDREQRAARPPRVASMRANA
ncbi:MAG: hypothetical protein WDW36_003384 [Sanguina aurantia]